MGGNTLKIHDILFGPREKPISLIIQEGNLEELKTFLKNGGDPNSICDNKSLLHFAIDNCEHNYFEVIKFLIDNGANINSHQSYLKETPLHRICARINPRFDIVQLLLDRGAKVNAENISGKTPVFYCNFSYSTQLLNLLVKYGSDVNHRDKYNNTLLHDDYLSCNIERFEDFLKILISLHFDINAKNNAGYTPLHLCKNEYIENILVKYGAK